MAEGRDLQRPGVERRVGDEDGHPERPGAVDAAPAGHQQARERVGALERQEGQRVERGLPEEAVDRHLAIDVAAVAEQVEEALVADLLLLVAALERALLLQLAVAARSRRARRKPRRSRQIARMSFKSRARSDGITARCVK